MKRLALLVGLLFCFPASADVSNPKSTGTGIYWDDLTVSALSARTPAAGAPGLETMVGTTKSLAFDAASDEEIYFTAQLSHAYKVGSAIYPHVHWAPSNTNAGNVIWVLECAVAAINGTITAEAANTATQAGSGTQWKQQIIAFGNTIACASCGISSIISCKLYRDADAGGDTYNADAYLLAVDFHYQRDTPGSRQELVK